MGEVTTKLDWHVIGELRPDRAGRPMIAFHAAGDLEAGGATVYRLDFLNADGTHAPADEHGEVCYVGQTSDLPRRISDYRYGRGGVHGATMKRRALVHADRHPSGYIRLSVAADPRIEVAGQQLPIQALGEPGRLLLEQAAIIEAKAEGRRLYNDDADVRRAGARSAGSIRASGDR